MRLKRSRDLYQIQLTHPFFFLLILSCAEHPELIEFSEHIESELKCRPAWLLLLWLAIIPNPSAVFPWDIPRTGVLMAEPPPPCKPCCAEWLWLCIGLELTPILTPPPAAVLIDVQLPMLCIWADVRPAWIDCLRRSSIVCRRSVISSSLRSAVAESWWKRCVMLERLCSKADTTWA